MAALLSSGKLVQQYRRMLSGFMSELAKKVCKPVVVVVDKASIHRAGAIQPALQRLEKDGMAFKLLPPYSLNSTNFGDRFKMEF